MRITRTRLSRAKYVVGFALALSPEFLMADTFSQVNLVSDVSAEGLNPPDPNLKNPWGVSFSPTSPFWISNQGSGTSTLYDGLGNAEPPKSMGGPLVVAIPGGNPTGQVFAGGSGFSVPGGGPAAFIFDTLNGTIDAWGGGASATQASSVTGAIYTGLTLATSGGSHYLYAADSTGQIRVFNSSYSQVTLSGNFTDPNAIAGFVPFNIQLIGSTLYVTYAKLSPMGTGLPGGYVDAFSTSGVFLNRVATNGALDAPWGIAQAPAGFGKFGNDLLIGNFGNTGTDAGEINAYRLNADGTYTWVGAIDGANGQPIRNDFLWSLDFRTGGPNVNLDALYFTAGVNNQKDGLFGEIVSTPEPSMALPVLLALGCLLIFKRRRVTP